MRCEWCDKVFKKPHLVMRQGDASYCGLKCFRSGDGSYTRHPLVGPEEVFKEREMLLVELIQEMRKRYGRN